MAVPEFYKFFRPLLEVLSDGNVAKGSGLFDIIADHMKLSDADREELLPSGNRTRVADRTLWAITYLSQAKLLDRPQRGSYQISAKGKEYLSTAPKVITPSDLLVFPEFVDFQNRTRTTRTTNFSTPPTTLSGIHESPPEETIEIAHREINAKLADELLDRIKAMPPVFFEQLIVKLMLKLGYGGSHDDAGKTIGKSGDGGVDGVIKQDKLGLDNIYLQAKRWSEGTVGRKEIQAFVGALAGRAATKGVFITTSTFTKEAQAYAISISSAKVSLIDGYELACLMIENDLGVSLVSRYDVKRIDSDFFEGE